MHEKIRYFSLFSGIGGFELGIEKATNDNGRFLQTKKTKDIQRCTSTPFRSTRVDCIGFSEVNKYAIQVYQQHYPSHTNYGDATKIETESLPDFDMLCGGFPCQSFSIAGKRKGFQDIRGTLFFEIYRIAKAKKPRLLFLENVKGLLSADDGRCFGTIISSLDELGYDVEWQVLNSKNFGVPQNRERVFIVGHRRGSGGQAVFPLREDGAVYSGEDSSQGSYLKSPIRGQGDKPMIIAPNNREHNAGDGTVTRKRYLTDTVPSLQAYAGNTQQSYVARYPIKFLERNQRNIEGDYSFTVDGVNTGGIMIRDGRDNRNCLRSGRTPKVGISGTSIRRLTPVECERLQGFPDGWTDGVSDTQRYKQLGNAVTVNVIQAIAEKLPCPFHGGLNK